MTFEQVVSILLCCTAALMYVNHRWLGLPTAIGILLLSSVFSLCWLLSHHLGFNTSRYAERMLGQIDFNRLLMDGLLSFMLFAGAFHVNLSDLARSKWTVAFLATFGVLASTLMVGLGLHLGLELVGIQLPLVFCFLFGALISPTDPISVLPIMRDVGAPRPLETKIACESLLNDGIGVVAFILVSSLAFAQTELGVESTLWLFGREAFGGLALGLGMGWLGRRLLGGIDDFQLEILLSLALVMGGYGLASALGASSPIAVVAAGLMIGQGRGGFAIKKRARKRLKAFWSLLDKSLNAMLLMLIGLEFLMIPFHVPSVLTGLFAILLVLGVRLLGVSLPVLAFRSRESFGPHAIKIMTWAGLRGGISVALALSLPSGDARDFILTVTYMIVLFSILVQGLTMNRLVAWTQRKEFSLP